MGGKQVDKGKPGKEKVFVKIPYPKVIDKIESPRMGRFCHGCRAGLERIKGKEINEADRYTLSFCIFNIPRKTVQRGLVSEMTSSS